MERRAYIKLKLSASEWGDKTVDELAAFIQRNNPELKGFERRGLYRMVQFYETYADTQIVSAVRDQLQSTDNQASPVRTQFPFQVQDIKNTILIQISWTHHRTIFSRCKIEEEQDFYKVLRSGFFFLSQSLSHSPLFNVGGNYIFS